MSKTDADLKKMFFAQIALNCNYISDRVELYYKSTMVKQSQVAQTSKNGGKKRKLIWRR